MNETPPDEKSTFFGAVSDLAITYGMYRKMMLYPKLLGEMREIFVSALEERGIIDRSRIEKMAREASAAAGEAGAGMDNRSFADSLIDLFFARHFNDEEIEAHINLARKRDRFRVLQKTVGEAGVTSRHITQALREFCEIPQGDLFISPSEAEGVRVALIDRFISNQLPFIGVAKRHLTIRDIDEIIDRIYLSRRRPGKIGGKAAGMLLAEKVLLPRLAERDPELEKYVRTPESYFFSSGIFSDFIDYNGMYEFHSRKYKTREQVEDEYKNISEFFRKASFPPDVVDGFRDFLEKVGPHPLILRSSSLLEDNVGHAFSGKYDSVFLANQGDAQTRLDEFMWGLKRVHMSIFGPAPILYRRDRDLLDYDEQMSILVQKVVGRRFGRLFFPFVAGVAFSRNPCRWTPRIRKEDGLARLVLGLGTRAVDRVGTDYPRMVPLGRPLLRPEIEAAQIIKYSQKSVDAIDLESGRLEIVSALDLLEKTDHPDLFYAVSVDEEGHLSPPMFKGKDIDLKKSCLTFENLLTKTPVVGLLSKMLKKLEAAYGHPVDVEFAWDEGRLYLLQCRALTVREGGRVTLPANVPDERVLFRNTLSLTSAVVRDVEYLVYIDPKAYGRISGYEEKLGVGRVVNRLNKMLREKRFALFGPGRWGSNDLNLGVRVGYEDINHTLVLGEIAFEEGGLTPEVSFGTHFFNDLIEAEIVPIPIYPDTPETLFREDFFLQSPNLLASLAPDFGHYESVVHVIHVPTCAEGMKLQIFLDGEEQKGVGFLDFSEDQSGGA